MRRCRKDASEAAPKQTMVEKIRELSLTGLLARHIATDPAPGSRATPD